tara:strand:+ start:933 stop:1178 length:246 start_codon:yes stop_codon:yes gene_type:complete
MTQIQSTYGTLRKRSDLANEVSNLTMHISGNSSELVQHLGFLGDKIEDQANATRDYLDDIRSSIDKNTEALNLIAQILRNK